MIFDPILDIFRGKTITIPPMDGAFRANTDLDDAPSFTNIDQADNLAILDGKLIASSGNHVYEFDDKGKASQLHKFDSEITAIAVSPDGKLTVALDNGELLIDGEKASIPASLNCITAIAYSLDGTMWLANGSTKNPASSWVVDLMQKNACGSIWKSEAGTGIFNQITDALAWPNGILVHDDHLVVSESWRHRLIRVDCTTGIKENLLLHIPGYPARLTPTLDGGSWMSVFAPRNRLIELVLQETHYRYDMMASVPRQFWIAPALSSGNSFLEPLQCGGMKLMGVHKPWAPSRSCGMAVHLDSSMKPTHSHHSRANGHRHGTCSAIEHDGRLYVAAKGGNCIVTIKAGKSEAGQ